ncbi:MAG: hypothetical protein R3264_23250 [Anaerolineae bacterium]|nr:hypothetical protein [Anaerolineae bacterium]
MEFFRRSPQTGRTETAESKPGDSEFTVIWAAPILPGKAEAWRRFMQEIVGDQRPAYEAACRRLNIQAMRGWVTETARGDIGVIAVISAQPEQVMPALSASEVPFDRWFRGQLTALQGVDISRPPRMPPSDLVLDWSNPEDREQRQEDAKNVR